MLETLGKKELNHAFLSLFFQQYKEHTSNGLKKDFSLTDQCIMGHSSEKFMKIINEMVVLVKSCFRKKVNGLYY